jgi:hypothetical protein
MTTMILLKKLKNKEQVNQKNWMKMIHCMDGKNGHMNNAQST